MNTQVDPLMLVQDLGQHLATSSLGVIGANLFLYTMPTSPVACRSIFADGGPRYAVEVVSRPHVQVIVRDTIVTSVSAVANMIWKHLDKDMVVMARCMGRFTADHYPVPYRDENNHWRTSMNFSFLGVTKVAGS